VRTRRFSWSDDNLVFIIRPSSALRRTARHAGRAVDALEAMGSHEAEGTAAERGTNATQRGGEGTSVGEDLP
jgi:hypothetical protein